MISRKRQYESQDERSTNGQANSRYRTIVLERLVIPPFPPCPRAFLVCTSCVRIIKPTLRIIPSLHSLSVDYLNHKWWTRRPKASDAIDKDPVDGETMIFWEFC